MPPTFLLPTVFWTTISTAFILTGILTLVWFLPWRSIEHDDVRRLHRRFGLLRHATPGHLDLAKWTERVTFLQEELDELRGAFETQDLAAQADALVDLVVVAHGTAVMLGLPWEKLWDAVQRANLAKVRGVGKRNHPVDLIKPPGWAPPDHGPALRRAGYDAEAWVHPDGRLRRPGRTDGPCPHGLFNGYACPRCQP